MVQIANVFVKSKTPKPAKRPRRLSSVATPAERRANLNARKKLLARKMRER